MIKINSTSLLILAVLPLSILMPSIFAENAPAFNAMMPSAPPNKAPLSVSKSGLPSQDKNIPIVQYTWLYQQAYNIPPMLTLLESTSTLQLDNIALEQGGYYTLRKAINGSVFVYDPLQVEVLNAPIIIQQPTGQHLVAGESLSLSLGASGGTPPLFYQWYKDTGSGFQQIGTGDTLQIQNIDAGDQGMYKCVVVDSALPTALTRDSDAAMVTVLEIVDSPPSEITIATGTDYTLTYLLDGGDVSTPGLPPSYQHLWEFMPLSGGAYANLAAGIDNTYTIVSASASTPLPDGSQGLYRYSVSDGTRSISKIVKVFVDANPIVISAQPLSAGKHQGNNNTFTIDAARMNTPTESLQFTWRYQATLSDSPVTLAIGGNIGVASTSTHSELTLSNLASGNAGYYSCIVSTLDASPISITSNPARLNVGLPLSLTLQPVGGIFHAGDVHPQLTVQSSGGIGEVSYQWWLDSGTGAVAVGGNTPTLDLTPLTVANAGLWYCVVQDEGIGEAPSITPTVLNSDTAQVVVAPAMAINAPVTPALQKLPNASSTTLTLDTANLGGQPPYTFQWYRTTGNTPIVGEQSDTLTLSQLNPTDTDLYYCRFIDSIGGVNGTAFSASTDIRVATPLQIGYQSSSVNGMNGQYFMLEVIAEGGLASLDAGIPYDYSWEKISGQASLFPVNDFFVEFNPLTANDVGSYRCTVSCGSESISSNIMEIMIENNAVPAATPIAYLALVTLLAVLGAFHMRHKAQS